MDFLFRGKVLFENIGFIIKNLFDRFESVTNIFTE